MTSTTITGREWARLLMILLLAACVRFIALDAAEFRYDEAELARLTLDLTRRGDLPLKGLPASVELPVPPTGLYLMAPPFAFSDDPLLATGFVALLNVIGVGLLWAFARRAWGPRVALIAALLYAISPWAIFYSRKIWVPDMHTPFLLAGALCAWIGFREGRRWAQALSLALFTLPFHFHYAGLLILPAWAWLAWRGRARLSVGAVIGGAALALLLLAPFLAGLGPADVAQVASFVGERSGGDGLGLSTVALGIAVDFASGAGVEALAAPDLTLPDLGILRLPLLLLVGLGAVVTWRQDRDLAIFLALWVGVTTLALTPDWVAVFPHYLLLILPALLLLVAAGFDALLRASVDVPARRWAVLLALALIVLAQGGWWFAFIDRAAREFTPNYGPTLRHLLPVRDAVRPFSDVLLVGGTRRHGPWLWEAMLYDSATCMRAVVAADGGVALFPAQPFAVLTPPGSLDFPYPDLYRGEEPAFYPMRTGEGAYRVDQFAAAPDWPGPPLTPLEPVRFDNGAALHGYALNGEQVTLDWRLAGRAARDYQVFVHFIDAVGERIGGRDAAFWPGRYWCADDRLVMWLDAAPPAETVALRVGLYHLADDGGFVNSLTESGAPWAEFALTEAES